MKGTRIVPVENDGKGFTASNEIQTTGMPDVFYNAAQFNDVIILTKIRLSTKESG